MNNKFLFSVTIQNAIKELNIDHNIFIKLWKAVRSKNQLHTTTAVASNSNPDKDTCEYLDRVQYEESNKLTILSCAKNLEKIFYFDLVSNSKYTRIYIPSNSEEECIFFIKNFDKLLVLV